jgi:pimeloyl-ACP methyl ester carboxylesterase
MHEEALDVLPALLDRAAISQPLLIGHSDGASIALIHAACAPRDTAGLVLMAPHIMVEPISVQSVARTSEAYAKGPLRARLARYHAHVDDTLHGWADVWLDPAFIDWSLEAEARALSLPTLLIQGRDDEYGTLAQIDRIAELAQGPTECVILDKCGHSPHRDQEAAVLAAIADFTSRHFPAP